LDHHSAPHGPDRRAAVRHRLRHALRDRDAARQRHLLARPGRTVRRDAQREARPPPRGADHAAGPTLLRPLRGDRGAAVVPHHRYPARDQLQRWLHPDATPAIPARRGRRLRPLGTALLHRRHGRVGRHHDTVGPDHDLTVEIGRYWSCSLRRPATPAAMSTTKTAVQTTFPVPPGRGRRAACADQPGPRTEMTDGPHLVNEVGAVDCFSRGAGQLVAGAAPPPLAGPPPVEPPPKPPEDGGSESPGPASPAGATLAATSSRSSSSSASGRGEPENVNLASSVLSDSPSQPSTSTETSSPAATSPKRI